MNKNDAPVFFEAWDAMGHVYNQQPTDVTKRVVWNALAKYELNAVLNAISAHVADPERGRFMPKPADIIAQIERLNPSPWLGADEAWALFPKSDTQTGCVTNEMSAAWAAASGLDSIAGRMAFRDTYNRLVDKAKAEGRSPKWTMTFGTDKAEAESAVLQAVELGRIKSDYAISLLPHLPEDEIKQIEGGELSPQKLLADNEQKLIGLDVVAERASDESSRKHLAELKSMLGMPDVSNDTAKDIEGRKKLYADGQIQK